MIIVLQCSASKNPSAQSFSLNGSRVRFYAHPDRFKGDAGAKFCPDELMPSSAKTWRDHLSSYNDSGHNPDGLLQAGAIYSPLTYRRIREAVGETNLYVLSAGWGLVRSDFLLPNYDITFSTRASIQPWKQRGTNDQFHDFAQLTQDKISSGESVYFFGGRDYLPLYYRLTQKLVARKVVYYRSTAITMHESYTYIRYHSRRLTNWHYSCAADFLADKIAR